MLSIGHVLEKSFLLNMDEQRSTSIKFLLSYFLTNKDRNYSYLFTSIQISYHMPRWVRSWVIFESLLF